MVIAVYHMTTEVLKPAPHASVIPEQFQGNFDMYIVEECPLVYAYMVTGAEAGVW
jgi:hypothetical protein